MSDDRYNRLKKRYDELIKENEHLREKIRKLESQQNPTIGLKVSPAQNTKSKQKNECDLDLESVDIPTNNII